MSDEKLILFTITKKDCRFDYYKGSGKGGQKRNKTSNCCRCTHVPSGAQATAEDGRSKDHNTRLAFKKMAESKKFQKWAKLEAFRKMGVIAEIEQKIEAEIRDNIKVEYVQNGRWTSEQERKEHKELLKHIVENEKSF